VASSIVRYVLAPAALLALAAACAGPTEPAARRTAVSTGPGHRTSAAPPPDSTLAPGDSTTTGTPSGGKLIWW
jgi:hypothetical protein